MGCVGWFAHEQVGPDHTLHIWPAEDVEPHRTEPGEELCWCEPNVLEISNPVVPGFVVHEVIHRDALDRSLVLEEDGELSGLA